MDHLIQANAVVNQVMAFANLLGPIAGGVLYGIFGVWPIIIISGVSFFLSAILEIFIRIPFTPPTKKGSLLHIVKSDFKDSMHFIGKERPDILKALLYTGAITFFVVAVATVGMPYLIRITLGLSAELYGITESVLGAAGIIGGAAAGIIATKLKTRKLYLLMAVIGVFVLPVGISFLIGLPAMTSYIVVTAAFAAIQFLVCLFTVFILSVIQQKTPIHLLGKVMAYVSTITMCAQPIGQAVYGVLFDWFKNNIDVLLIATAIMITVIGGSSKKTFYKLEQ